MALVLHNRVEEFGTLEAGVAGRADVGDGVEKFEEGLAWHGWAGGSKGGGEGVKVFAGHSVGSELFCGGREKAFEESALAAGGCAEGGEVLDLVCLIGIGVWGVLAAFPASGFGDWAEFGGFRGGALASIAETLAEGARCSPEQDVVEVFSLL
jgi:hypothetical protein